MAAYPDPPPVIPLPDTGVAQAAYAETLLSRLPVLFITAVPDHEALTPGLPWPATPSYTLALAPGFQISF